jgi:cobalamin biosynthesis protein CobD/CbiB
LQPYLEAPLDKNDSHTLVRRAIEFIAFALHRFLLAPVFWFLAAGPLGLSLYVTGAALYHSFGRADKRRRAFGMPIRVVYALFNFTAFLTALMLVISMLFVNKSNKKSPRIASTQRA